LDIGAIWDTIILSPMINILVVLSDVLFDNLGLTIIVLTIIVRAAMYPLTRRQLRATKGMQELQPKLAEIRKKYAKDKQRRAQEEMALMKQSGISAQGCLVPMLIQMPIWIALYHSIIRLLPLVPEDFLNLSRHLYTAWPMVFGQVPLDYYFLGMNLASPNMFMPILVGGSMWVQQKMTTPQSTDPQQRAQGQMMQWMFPLMFAFLSLTFPSGLSLYWTVSNLITIAMQYYTSGWGGMATVFGSRKTEVASRPRQRPTQTEKKISAEDSLDADIVISRTPTDEGREDGTTGDKRPDSRGSDSDSSGGTGRQSRRGKGRRSRRR
jgi:YidC/Oxa1 family membrane protein insertase